MQKQHSAKPAVNSFRGESFLASCYYLITLMFAVMAGKYDDDYYDGAVLLCTVFESEREVNERHKMTLRSRREVP